MTTELAKQYKPADVESAIIARWNESHCFHAKPDYPGPAYSIVIPPPNVTAALHMGHALNNTLQDILTRYHRMRGFNTLWMPGTDHAGIATQTIVDKRLQAEGQPALKDYKKLEAEGKAGREQFIAKVQAWKDEYEAVITGQLKSMGCSCDWDRQRFTMDDICAKAVREAFFQLFKDGLIYRGKRLVNWDPVSQTALADDEVEMEEVDGNFYYMKYPLADGSGHVTVATTRPETMLGDTAVAVNPRDPERAAYIGKEVRLPIVNRIIPIIGDDYVVMPDPESQDAKARYASGFLKVTPAHDPNDYDIGQRHGLPVINIMAPDASISKDHGWPEKEWADEPSTNEPTSRDRKGAGHASTIDPFASTLLGQSREDARKSIVIWFKEHDLMQEVRPYRHSVGHSYRSHVPIEPYLSDQWYVKVTDDRLTGAALQAMNPEQVTTSLDHKGADQASIDPTSRDRKGAGPQSATDSIKSNQHYLITFTTYGSWLHGNEKGTADRNHNIPGTPYLDGNENLEQFEQEQLKHDPVTLDEPCRIVVRDTIQEVCRHRGWALKACNVRTNHVHVVVSADSTPEHIMNDFKSYATRRLIEQGLQETGIKTWTRHGSTRYLNYDEALVAAVKYVLEEQGEDLGATAIDNGNGSTHPNTGPLPHGRGSSESNDQPTSRNNADPTSRDRKGAGHDSQQTYTSHKPTGDKGGHRSPAENTKSHLTFHPARYAKTFQNWHENIRDWCISRQLWWGHRIPVWRFAGKSSDVDSFTHEGRASVQYHDDSTFVCVRDSMDQQLIDALEQGGYTQDPDVLDTWFSSALWPMSTMGWPDGLPGENLSVLDKWNPTNVLCTAREIITLWVSRMVMFNLYLHDRLPFTDVFIHAMIQDGEGQKMSKSLGNGVDPLDIIHSHGSDAMRYTLAAMTTQTQDVRMPVDLICPHTGETFSPKMITTKAGTRVAAPVQEYKGNKCISSFGIASGEAKPTDDMPAARNTSSKFDEGRNFANKLWNAVRFALSNLSSDHATPASPACATSLADRWILSRLIETVHEADRAITGYEFSNYARSLYDFIWRDFCDWYIEAIKPTVRDNRDQQQILAVCIDVILRLLHPMMPFITERLNEALNTTMPQRAVTGIDIDPADLLATASWPVVDDALRHEDAENAFEQLRMVITMIREVRSSNQLSPREMVEISARLDGAVCEQVETNRLFIQTIGHVKIVALGPDVERPAGSAAVVRPIGEIYLHNQLDADSERDRLGKRRDELQKAIANLRGRLSNESYVQKAPPHLVQQTHNQLTDSEKELESIEKQLAAL